MYDNGICPAPDDSKVEDEESGPTVGDVRSSTALAKKFEKESKVIRFLFFSIFLSGGWWFLLAILLLISAYECVFCVCQAVGTAQEASLYRKELVVVHYNTKSRPCQSGVRGMEVCGRVGEFVYVLLKWLHEFIDGVDGDNMLCDDGIIRVICFYSFSSLRVYDSVLCRCVCPTPSLLLQRQMPRRPPPRSSSSSSRCSTS